ncbi:MAG: hypothetical protein IJH65_08815 [Methanobrevibacter sp.]|nr:hypothetical protein [Methanobrevibacter sp.]
MVSEKLYDYVRKRFGSDELIFTRIDLLRDNTNGIWEVLEFEAIDPSMYGSVSSITVDALSLSLLQVIENGHNQG